MYSLPKTTTSLNIFMSFRLSIIMVLIFTASINKSEHYSNLLKKRKTNHIVLNAKNHEREAEIIANAGTKNSIIITTSISGRGVDIKLGGKENKNNEKDEIKS